MRAAVRGLSDALFALLAILAATGGAFVSWPGARIEFVSLDPWMAALLVLAVVWTRVLREPLERLGWLGQAVVNLEKRLRSGRSAQMGALIGVGAVFFLLFLAHGLRHWALRNHGCDVSMVHQPLFYPWGSPPLRADFSRVGTALSEHLVYVFFLLGPLVAPLKSAWEIYAIQALIVGGATAALVVAGPLKRAPQAMALGAAVLLASRSLRAATVWDFREDDLLFAALIVMILGLIRGRAWIWFTGLALALSCKENAFAVTLLMAVPLLASRESRFSPRSRAAIAAITAVASLAYGVIAFKWLIPQYTHHDQGHALFARYGKYGSTVSGIVVNVLTSPRIWLELLSEIFNGSGFRYLLFLLLPLAPFFRSRETWIWLAPASIGILMNVAHPYHLQRAMIFHYEMIFLPFLFMAALTGIGEAVAAGRPRRALWALGLALAVSGQSPVWAVRENIPAGREFKASRALSALRTEERVAVGERLSAQLNHLPRLRVHADAAGIGGTDAELEAFIREKLGDATLWVLDQDNALDQRLRDWALKHGGRLEWGELGASRAVILRMKP